MRNAITNCQNILPVKNVSIDMARITARAVSSSPSSSITSTLSKNSRSSTTTSTSSSASNASKSTVTISRATKTTATNANYIINGGRPARSVTTDISNQMLAMPLVAFNDPLPFHSNSNANSQQFDNNALPATNTTTGTTYVFPYPNGGRRTGSGRYNKTAAERKLEQEEFYATYDVMTGVRIAATLSGFFGLMVFLIVWKSRSSSNETLKVLKDPKMAAVAAVCMQEEEEREIQEAMVATGMSIYPDEYDAIIYRRQRMLSLGNVSAPPLLNRGYRFSSVGGGGYSSLLEPPRRFSYSATSGIGSFAGGRRKSGSESSRILSNYPMGSSFGNDDYFIETEDELECTDYPRSGTRVDEMPAIRPQRTYSTKSKSGGLLEVPPAGQDSRRSSAMTCCSTESSYLERRCSAFTLGLGNLPPTLQRKLSTASRASSTDNWDYYYPDIQVIQPTPKPSPCPSERSLYEQLQAYSNGTSTSNAKEPNKAQALTAAKPTMVATITTHSKTGTTNTIISADTKLTNARKEAHKFVRKHSIAFCDPESAQAGRKQEIHSISADTVDIYPYNQTLFESSGLIGFVGDSASSAAGSALKSTQQTAPPTSTHYGFHYSDSPTDDLHGSICGKVAILELQRINTSTGQMTPPSALQERNNNSFPFTSSASIIASATAGAAAVENTTTANSSSISMDSNVFSLEKLNGSGSLGTISAKALFNAEKRAPLASLSSFKISSLEYQDSVERSVDDDSVFVNSVADTDEDMQQYSSDSEDISFGEHDPEGIHENLALVARQNSGCGAIVSGIAGVRNAADTSTRAAAQQTVRYPIEKRYSLGAATNDGGVSATKFLRARRPLLQRHRTISVSSSDRVALLGHQLKEFQHPSGSGSQTPTTIAESVPFETHFGSIICTSSSPRHPRRAQLLQQYSDPHSLPTTTTTTATTNTEEDTCSTLNTELCGAAMGFGPSSSGGGSIGRGDIYSGGGGGSATLTQNSSLNTVVSFGRASPQTVNNQTSCSLGGGASDASAPAAIDVTVAGNQRFTETTKNQTNITQPQQLPCSRLYDDHCSSSVSDSMIIRSTTRQPIICMPSSLKNLIIRGSGSATSTAAIDMRTDSPGVSVVSKSATNLSFLDVNRCRTTNEGTCQSFMLELPLIKLPTDESSDSSSASDHVERARKESEETCEATHLTGSNRKWSKETLF
ncbi:serine-rich adhesin for platelets isoform X2 [Eurosta solidaginis]|uniref:serine-rich adhesin for platelets isoform X2 n=1 Tax=Eurosta solidaginis TaxID=178769 RepID=UPI0035313CAC